MPTTTVKLVLNHKDVEALDAAAGLANFLAGSVKNEEDTVIDEWIEEAKEYQHGIRDLYNRVNDAFDQGDTIDDNNSVGLLRRPDLSSGTNSSSHNPIGLLEEKSEDEGPTRPRKRARLDSDNFAADQEATPTQKAAFFRALAEAHYTHSFDFSENCTAIKAVTKKRPVPAMGHVMAEGYLRIDLTLLYDTKGTAVFLPSSAIPYMMDFISFVRGLDKEQLTDTMPALFILKHFLRVMGDFGPVALRYEVGEDDKDNGDKGVIDIYSTLQAWKIRYQSSLGDISADLFAIRIVAMRKYMEAHGVVKAGALTFNELSDLSDAVTTAQLDEAYGRGKFSAIAG